MKCVDYGEDSTTFVLGKVNSEAHQSVLASHLLTNAEFFAEENWNYQQDHALTHRSNNRKNWFQVNKLKP